MYLQYEINQIPSEVSG